MKLKPLEERIIRLVKTTEDGDRIEEAEIRQLVIKEGTLVPDYIKVLPARLFGVQLTMHWNGEMKKFTTETSDGAVWTSDFDYNQYLPQSWDSATIARSPRRGRKASSEESLLAKG